MRPEQHPPRRSAIDFPLFLLTLLFVGFGLVMVFSASSMTSWQSVSDHSSAETDGDAVKADPGIAGEADRAGSPDAAGESGAKEPQTIAQTKDQFDPWYYTKRQALFAMLGLMGMFVAMTIPYHKLRKLYVPFFLLMVPLLAVTPAIAPNTNGARSWIYIGPFGLQPAEFAKLALILYLAAVVSKKGEQIRDLRKGFLPIAAVVGVFAFLIMLQPDMGTTLVLLASAAVVLVVGGADWRHLAASGLLGLTAATALILQEDYRIARFTVFLNPEKDRFGEGYQLLNSLYAFSHGGLNGVGLGKSIQKLYYIPEAHNDFIFAIIGEELGFIGTGLFLICYLLFIWRGIIVSLRSPDSYAMLLGVGIMGWLAIQAIVNIGGVTGSIPLTGVTLPLISYGGSSLLVTMTAIGIVLGISRYAEKPPKSTRKQQSLRSAS